MCSNMRVQMSPSGKEEWKLMISGQVYQDTHPDIDKCRRRAENLFIQYNQTQAGQVEERQQILHSLLGSMGEDLVINPDFRCEFGSNISIGDYTLINYGCVMLDNAPITIEDHVWIGPGVGLFCTNHALDYQERREGACQAEPIRIGQGSWLGGHVVVLGGVSIGRGTVIGAGSIVTRDIPDQVIAVGNPCKVVRKITESDKTGYLERIRRRNKASADQS